MGGWRPWAELRARTHVVLEWRRLPAKVRGLWARTASGSVIVLDVGLDRRARRCVLTHELVHDERGLGHEPGIAPAVLAKEEALVAREAARRLVPLDELETFVAGRATIEGVTAADVADEFDVSEDVAVLAIELLCRG